MFATPASAVSTLPNTPNMGPMVAPPTLFTFGTAQPVYPIGMTATPMVPIQTVYNAQPYLTETNTTFSPSCQLNNKESVKLARPAPTMDPNEAKEFRENPTKAVKKDTEGYMPAQNPLQVWNLPSLPGMTDSFKLDEYSVPLNLSRGPSFNGGELGFSRYNSFNVPRIPNSLEVNFAQCKIIQI